MPADKASNRRKIDGRGQLDRGASPIDMLPDDVLLEVFKFYLPVDATSRELDNWHELVHVCRRWRQVVFASPHQLNLRLLCTDKRSVKLLDIWPTLSIVIDHNAGFGKWGTAASEIDTVVEHNDRICEITIDPVDWDDVLLMSMGKPFPALTVLKLCSEDELVPFLPESFLAPSLRKLNLRGVSSPGLPKLIMSSHHLVELSLCQWDNPDSGFISPETMVTCLSSLTHLEVLALEVQTPLHQTNRHSPPLTHTVLPSLTSLQFEGVHEYLEDIMARIDAPLLDDVQITFSCELMFNTPQLRSFISRTEAFEAFHQAEIVFFGGSGDVILQRELEGQAHNVVLQLRISYEPDQQLSSMASLCNSLIPPLPTLEHLYICEGLYRSDWGNTVEDTQWLELFHPFIAVKSLYLDDKNAPRVSLALQDLTGERVIEVLPALQNIFVQGPVQQGIAQFIAARRHPLSVQAWGGRQAYW